MSSWSKQSAWVRMRSKSRLADVTIVVLVPGMGDDVQAIKAGIMEIADVFVINKADLPGADKLERELHGYMGLSHRPDGWTPPIVHTVASDGTGISKFSPRHGTITHVGPRASERLKSGRFDSVKCCAIA